MFLQRSTRFQEIPMPSLSPQPTKRQPDIRDILRWRAEWQRLALALRPRGLVLAGGV